MDHWIRFESEILHPMGNYKVPVITLSHQIPKEAVCQVFENVNTGGVSLTVFELITATFAADNFELRKDWDKRIFSPRDLPYSTQLIPLSVLFAILKNKSFDGTIRDKISQWYWCGVFGEMYGGANESRYVSDVTGMMNWIRGNEEPDTIARA